MSNRYLQHALCPDCGSPLVTDGRRVRCTLCEYQREGSDEPTASERGAWADRQRCEGCE